MARTILVDITGEVMHETEMAWLFHDGDKQVWLAKSLVEWGEDVKEMTMPEWLAIERGLI